jgi:hypothetical protein
MERLDALHHHPNLRTRTAIAMMLAEMQQQAAARHLAIERKARIKAMVEVDRETKKAQIEFIRLRDIEDAQDGMT